MSGLRFAAVLALIAIVGFVLMMVAHANETVVSALFIASSACLALAAVIVLWHAAKAVGRQVSLHRHDA